MIKKQNLTLLLFFAGEKYPIAYEIEAEPESFISSIKNTWECKEVSNRHKPIVLPYNNGHRRIRAEDILYLEAGGSYCTIHFRTGKDMLVAVAMGTLADDLCEQGIVRCHKRYAVNIHAVNFLGGNYLVLQDDVRIDMGAKFKKAITSCFIFHGTKSRKYR